MIKWMAQEKEKSQAEFYCAKCNRPVSDPLACGDCGALICRVCGAPLESADELGFG